MQVFSDFESSYTMVLPQRNGYLQVIRDFYYDYTNSCMSEEKLRTGRVVATVVVVVLVLAAAIGIPLLVSSKSQ